MSKKNVEILLLGDSEIDEVNNFHNFIYKDSRNKDQFQWEFLKAPAGKAIYVIAKDVDNNKIVGTQCAIPIELIKADGTVILTAKSEDTLVNPEYRGLNIFENMYQLLFEKCREAGIKYLWGFTTAKKPFLKLGFEIPFDHSQSLIVKDIFTSYNYLSNLNSKNNFLSRFKILGLCAVSKVTYFKNIFISEQSLKGEISYSQNDKEIIDNNQLIISSGNKGFWIKQDVSFLKWRIATNPYHEHIFNINFSIKSNIIATIVFNHHRNGIWYLINDVYAAKLNDSQKAIILKKALKLLFAREKGGVKLIRTWDFTHNNYGRKEISIREKAGFTHLDRGISFVWKNLDENNSLNAIDFNLSRLSSQGVI